MPVIVSPQHGGWVRTPAPRRRAASPEKQRENILNGPLAYFAGTSAVYNSSYLNTGPPNPMTKLPPCPKYDYTPEEPRKKKKSRVVSAPVMANEESEDEDDMPEPEYTSVRTKRTQSRRTVSAAPERGLSYERQRPAAAVQERRTYQHTAARQETGGSKYWSGPSNRSTGRSEPRRDYARSTASSGTRWASATQPLVFD